MPQSHLPPNTHAQTPDELRVDILLGELAARLSRAAEDTAIGAAIQVLAKRFGMTDVIICDVAKARDGLADAIVFSSAELPRLSLPTLIKHPIARRALAASEPISLAEILQSMGAAHASLPRSLRDHDALNVTVDADQDAPFSVLFAGKDARLDGLSRSLLCLAAQLAIERRRYVKSNPPQENALTDRESEALHLLADGRSDAEIAAAMKIAQRTVRFHITNAKAKLGVSSRAQAILTILRAGTR